MNPARLRQAFLRGLGDQGQLLALFQLLPDVSFFLKDRKGRFIALNPRGCEYCGVTSEREALGKVDRDFFPRARAADYMADDQAVMKHGRPMLNRIEPAPEWEGSPHLVVTSKIPLRDAKGRIVGLAGVSRRVEQVRSAPAAQRQLAKAIEYLHEHYHARLQTAALARMAALSVSQFERTFRKAFACSPRRYLQRVRVEAASRRLAETQETIAAIAVDCGFYDHAHFTRSFTALMGTSPSRHRQERQDPKLRSAQLRSGVKSQA